MLRMLSRPHRHTLCDEACTAFQNYRGQAEIRLRPGEDLGSIADWGNKFPGSVARIAGILHLLQYAGQAEPWQIAISKATIESAITIGDYFAEHAMVAYALMGADAGVEKARRLWAIIQHHGFSSFSLRELHQKQIKQDRVLVSRSCFLSLITLEKLLCSIKILWSLTYFCVAHTI
ncbi:DUF3987 domain-containing protein [Chloroflexota bacterium]